MRSIRRGIQLLASPLFFFIAVVLYLNPYADHGAMMAGHMVLLDGEGGKLSLFGFDLGNQISVLLGSMWFMYVLMGVVHLGAWLDWKKNPQSL
jgi:hypothetical protein